MIVGLQYRTGAEIPRWQTEQSRQRPTGCNRDFGHYPTRMITMGIGFRACLRAMALLNGDVPLLHPDPLFLSEGRSVGFKVLMRRFLREGAAVFGDDDVE